MLHQNQNDQRPIVYIVVVEYISSVEMLRFVIICHYPGGPHVAAPRGNAPTFLICYNKNLPIQYHFHLCFASTKRLWFCVQCILAAGSWSLTL